MTRPMPWAMATLGLVVALGAWPVARSDRQATFRSGTEAVRVDVLVTERGRPVRGLTPADFEVLDSGVPQQVDYAAFEEIPLNVVFVLDMSVSVSGERLGHLQEAGAAVLEGLKAGDQAALVTFDHAVVLRAPLTGDRGRVREALLGPPSAGMTSLIDATYAGMIVAESDVGRGLVLVFSDGLDVSSWLRPDLVREVARRSNAVVYGVVVRSPARPEFLSEIGRLSGGDVFEVESTRNLHQTFARVLDEFRHRYLVSYQPRGVPRGGWHPLEVRVKKAGASVKARPGYLAGR